MRGPVLDSRLGKLNGTLNPELSLVANQAPLALLLGGPATFNAATEDETPKARNVRAAIACSLSKMFARRPSRSQSVGHYIEAVAQKNVEDTFRERFQYHICCVHASSQLLTRQRRRLHSSLLS